MRAAIFVALLLASCTPERGSDHHAMGIGGGPAFGVGAIGGGGGGSAVINCPVGQYSSSGVCIATPIFWSRDFRLNQSTLSTPTLPPNTSAAHSVAQCVVSSGTTWTCTKAAGGTDTVTQGTSPVGTTDAQGHLARDDVTFASTPALSTASDFASSFNGANTVAIYAIGTNASYGGGSVLPGIDLRPGVGTNILQRGGGSFSSPTWSCLYGANTAVSSGGPLDGLSFYGCSWDGVNTITAFANGCSGTHSGTTTYTSGGTLRFFGDAGNDNLGGTGELVQLYSDAESITTLTQNGQGIAGLVADNSTTSSSNSPINFARTGPQWLLDGNGRVWKYGGGDSSLTQAGMPVVTSRGLELVPGSASSRPQANGFIAGYSIGQNLGAATAIGTPTLTTLTASGPYAHLANCANGCASDVVNTKDGALVVDDDGSNFEGYKGSIAPGDDEVTTGEYTDAVFASQGTSGVTTDKLAIGFLTDGTIQTVACPLSLPAGLSCSTITPTIGGKNGGFCAFSGHTASIQRDICHVDIEGSPTSIRAAVVVGNAVADTGSITIYGVQAGWGRGIPQPIGDNGITAQTFASIPATETATWPQGDQRGIEVEFCGELDYDLPTEAGVNTNGEYIFNTSDGGSAETMLMMFETGASDGHAATDLYVRIGLRSVAYNSTCTGGAFGNGGTDLTSPGTLGTYAAGTPFCERWVIKPAGTVASVPRVNHWIYFDAFPGLDPANLDATHHATTLRASNTSGTMCASDFSETYGLIGGRTSGASPLNAISPMQGAVARFTVRQAL